MTAKSKRMTRLSAHLRDARGNMLAYMTACGIAFMALLLFALSYVRLLGSHGEQKTAIDAAALAAAKDLSRIVINDPNFGYIGFSDSAPVGAATKAGDNYYMPVSSVNTLMGTIRLDLLIADALGNAEMKDLAVRDLNNLKTAKDDLIAAMNTSLIQGGVAHDADGHDVTPYEDAVAAYQQNTVRMSGGSSYVANSLKLTLGAIPGGETNIPVASPSTYANTSASQQSGGHYLAGMDIPVPSGEHFVFANLGDSVRLVDNAMVQTTIASLPYQMPSIVRAEADQSLNDNGAQRVVHCAASAQPCNVVDPKPAPGALSIAFPDGVPPEITKPGDLLKPPFTSTPPVVGQSPPTGDYPTDPGTSLPPVTSWPGLSGPPTAGGAFGVGLYDWIRRAGPKVKIDSLLKAMNTVQFADTGNNANNVLTTNYYTFDGATGNVVYAARKLSDPDIPVGTIGSYNPPGPDPISVVSHNQLFASSLETFTSVDRFSYDMYVRDEAWKPGITNGGKHGGEPLDATLLSNAGTLSHVPFSNMTIASADLEPVKIAMGKTGSGSSYDCGGQGDGAYWGITLGGPPGVLLAGLFVKFTTTDNHQIQFAIYSNGLFTRNDWGQPLLPAGPYACYTTGPATGYNRPTYLQNGLVTEVRLRRAISLTQVLNAGVPLVGKGYANNGRRKYPLSTPLFPVAPLYNLFP